MDNFPIQKCAVRYSDFLWWPNLHWYERGTSLCIGRVIRLENFEIFEKEVYKISDIYEGFLYVI